MARLEDQVDSWLYDYAAAELGKGDDEDDTEPPPLRLNYPINYLLHAWSDYKTHGHWPRPGGFDAQDEALVQDFQTLTRRYNWHARRIMDDTRREDGHSARPDRLRDVAIKDLFAGADSQSWGSFMRE